MVLPRQHCNCSQSEYTRHRASVSCRGREASVLGGWQHQRLVCLGRLLEYSRPQAVSCHKIHCIGRGQYQTTCQPEIDRYIEIKLTNFFPLIATHFIFQGLDELIRVHKLSCLKITCINVCKDTLWIGTSAGIVINLKIPHITNTTSKINTNLTLNGIVLIVKF
jgi:hypothetical protein